MLISHIDFTFNNFMFKSLLGEQNLMPWAISYLSEPTS
jgi:hypothetical protein